MKRRHTSSSSSSSSATEGDQANSLTLWQRAFIPGQTWDKEDFKDIVFWTRQVLALACGLVFGVIPMKGFAAVLLAVMANLAGTQVYFSKYLGIDLDLLNVEPADAHKEGAGPAFAVYMLSWVCTYSIIHEGF